MNGSFVTLIVTTLSIGVLCVPPALALRMFFARLIVARQDMRWPYVLFCVLTVLMLMFNLSVATGVTGQISSLTPPILSANPLTSALLFAWTATGMCLMVALIVPRRGRASQL